MEKENAGRPESSAGLGSIKAARRTLEVVDVGLKRATESGERERLQNQRPVRIGKELCSHAEVEKVEREWAPGGVGVAEGLARSRAQGTELRATATRIRSQLRVFQAGNCAIVAVRKQALLGAFTLHR